jgi:hypothetical protein
MPFEVQIRRWRCTDGGEGIARTGIGEAASAISATGATSSGCAGCSMCSRRSATRRVHPQPQGGAHPEEVYTFTPKGLVGWRRAGDAVDFAHTIHTDVGHQCRRERQDGAARTRLKNGDIVEIVTQTGHKPSRTG